jgi:hypothetical protein
MPKVTSAGMTQAHGAIVELMASIGLIFDVDHTSDSDNNTTGLYAYGNINEDSFSYRIYGKPMWYVKTVSNYQYFCFCDNIYFYDDYDKNGNFLGRKVSISGSTTLFSYSLPRDIIYSYNAGGLAFYIDRIIMNDYGSIWSMPVGFAGNGYYDGSSTLVTQKLRWLRWGEIRSLDAYWGSLNNYEVVQIGGSYYFKISGYNALFPGDGTEGTVKSLDVTIVSEELGNVYYINGIEPYEEGYMLGVAKQLKARFELA